MLHVEAHPLLQLEAFVSDFPRPLGEMTSPAALLELLRLGAAAPLSADDAVRAAVRDLLRHGGYKPTGRGKPASEYLLRASADGTLGGINLAVDVCNVVSLHSGLPISVVDLDLAAEPLRVGVSTQGQAYAFNAAGQSIDVGGLLCLADAAGPCANAVKDAQRTKTRAETRRTLSLVWGTVALAGRAAQAAAWYRELLRAQGVATTAIHS